MQNSYAIQRDRVELTMYSWLEFTDDEYTAIWDRFYSEFKFKPDCHERSKPAIDEPRPFITFDLSSNLNDKTIAEIGKVLLESFRALSTTSQHMYRLDWQHTCYRFDPHLQESNKTIGWYPDGDYYIFLAFDFSFGTFGHPWQESLCVFGKSLLNLAEQPLRDKLAVLRESPYDKIVG